MKPCRHKETLSEPQLQCRLQLEGALSSLVKHPVEHSVQRITHKDTAGLNHCNIPWRSVLTSTTNNLQADRSRKQMATGHQTPWDTASMPQAWLSGCSQIVLHCSSLNSKSLAGSRLASYLYFKLGLRWLCCQCARIYNQAIPPSLWHVSCTNRVHTFNPTWWPDVPCIDAATGRCIGLHLPKLSLMSQSLAHTDEHCATLH